MYRDYRMRGMKGGKGEARWRYRRDVGREEREN